MRKEKQRLLLAWMASHGEPKTGAEIRAAGFAVQTATVMSDNYKYAVSTYVYLHKDDSVSPPTWQINDNGLRTYNAYIKAVGPYAQKSNSQQQQLVDAIARIDELESEIETLEALVEDLTPKKYSFEDRLACDISIG